MTPDSENSSTADPGMSADVQFAMAVAGRALVRLRGANPYENVVTAYTETRMGAWPKSFGVLLVVGEKQAVAELTAVVRVVLEVQTAAEVDVTAKQIGTLVDAAVERILAGQAKAALR